MRSLDGTPESGWTEGAGGDLISSSQKPQVRHLVRMIVLLAGFQTLKINFNFY